MKKLVFIQLTLLSKKSKRARRLKLHPKITIIKGENDTGKSSLVKSLYYTLGTDVPQLNNNKWEDAAPVYMLDFSIDGVLYKIIRDGRVFGIFNAKGILIHTCQGITSARGISHALGKLLGYSLEFEDRNTNNSRIISPSHYFVPFYIDQDRGWQTTWRESFSDLQQFQDFRTKIIEYHLSIKPEEYYTKRNELERVRREFKNLGQEKDSFVTARDSINKKYLSNSSPLSITEHDFRDEIKSLETNLTQLEELQYSYRKELLKNSSQKIFIENELVNVRKQQSELTKDYTYALKSLDEEVICPTCGTNHRNSIANRFSLLEDIETCKEIETDLLKALAPLNDKLSTLQSKYDAIVSKTNDISVQLSVNKQETSLAELVQSKAKMNVMEYFSSSLMDINFQQETLETKDKDLEKEIKNLLSPDRVAKIKELYQSKMKLFLSDLNVSTLKEEDYKSHLYQLNNDITGSDKPRAVLAQYYSYICTMKEMSSNFLSCPLVIDTPMQQDQDKTNAPAMLKFIFDRLPADTQLILATVDNLDILPERSEYKIETLEVKFSALQAQEYIEIVAEMEPLIKTLLEANAGISLNSDE